MRPLSSISRTYTRYPPAYKATLQFFVIVKVIFFQEKLGRSDLAIPALRLAAGQGSPKALVILGNFAYWGTGMKANATHSLQLFAAAARSDSAHGAFNCGMMWVTARIFPSPSITFFDALPGTFWVTVSPRTIMKRVFGASLPAVPFCAN
jgi:hypothetical protein